MNTAEINLIAAAIVQKLRPVVKDEIRRIASQERDDRDTMVGINEIAKILGHSTDWCRRKENRIYPHCMVGHRIMAPKNKLMDFARLNGMRRYEES